MCFKLSVEGVFSVFLLALCFRRCANNQDQEMCRQVDLLAAHCHRSHFIIQAVCIAPHHHTVAALEHRLCLPLLSHDNSSVFLASLSLPQTPGDDEDGTTANKRD